MVHCQADLEVQYKHSIVKSKCEWKGASISHHDRFRISYLEDLNVSSKKEDWGHIFPCQTFFLMNKY